MRLQSSPVKQTTLAAGLSVIQPQGLRLGGRFDADAQAAQAQLRAWAPEVLVVAAYGLILPAWLLALLAGGCTHSALHRGG